MTATVSSDPLQVAVIGAGYVGLVTGAGLSAIGHRVVVADVDPERVAVANSGKAPFHEPGLDDLLRESIDGGRFRATTDVGEALAGSNLSIIAVGTPSNEGDIDLSFVRAAARTIGERLAELPEGHVVVVKSTVVPGTTVEVVGAEVLAASGLPRERFGLSTNPEFLREGSAVEDFMDPDRIVIGADDDRAAEVMLRLYEPFDCPKLRVAPATAELIKYTSNSLLATLISFSNEIARFCEAIPGTDVETVLEGVHFDRRLSPRLDGRRITPQILSYLRAGAGYGGSCLPKDVDALRASGRKRAVATPLLDAVVAVNRSRPSDLVQCAERELGSLAGRTVAVLGVAFKPGTDDLRESPALRMIDLLRAKGASVRAHDPMVPPDSRHAGAIDAELCASLPSVLEGADAAVLVTAWPEYRDADWQTLAGKLSAGLLVDGRNQLRDVVFPDGFRYRAAGRNAAGA